ncbi:MAG TPA: hypothetical protein VGM90_26705 [Kofleriaceae bacterium]|jgi:hypothetical protein
MSFEPANKKLSIGSIDDHGISVTAQYNPKELQVDKTVPWSKVNQSNQSNNEGVHLEFTGAEGRSMTVELLFDGYEKNASVAGEIEKLEKLASVRIPTSKKGDERRPHRCTVSWGDQGLPRFDCVIESLSTKYTMFSSGGAPLRATCTVKLKEANVVSMAKASGGAAPAATPASGGGTGGTGGTGSGSGTGT